MRKLNSILMIIAACFVLASCATTGTATTGTTTEVSDAVTKECIKGAIKTHLNARFGNNTTYTKFIKYNGDGTWETEEREYTKTFMLKYLMISKVRSQVSIHLYEYRDKLESLPPTMFSDSTIYKQLCKEAINELYPNIPQD